MANFLEINYKGWEREREIHESLRIDKKPNFTTAEHKKLVLIFLTKDNT